MEVKGRLEKEVWSKKEYYKFLHHATLETSHPVEKILKELSEKSLSLLDLGCGDGTRLNILCKNGKKKGVGVDISSVAVGMARKNYPKLRFIKSDLEEIPLKDMSFDLVYCAYVLEHLVDPEKVIEEAIRVTRKGGRVVFVSPNFGSPNRASPPFKGLRVQKLILGLLKDFYWSDPGLGWNKVEPIANKERYEPDWDSTTEPYLGSLVRFLEKRGMGVIVADSSWGEELAKAKFHQQVFRFLGERGVYPFWMWGPHLLVVAEKVSGKN